MQRIRGVFSRVGRPLARWTLAMVIVFLLVRLLWVWRQAAWFGG